MISPESRRFFLAALAVLALLAVALWRVNR